MLYFVTKTLAEVVMTPTKKGKTTHIKIERKKREASDAEAVVHVAGGPHSGLVIAKNTAGNVYLSFIGHQFCILLISPSCLKR